MSAIWSPSRRKLIWQPPVPRPLAKWLRAHEVAGIYQTVPGGRWDAKSAKLQAVTTVARTAGLCASANSYNVTVAVPGQDLGAVWFAQIALDNASHTGFAAALYSSENYTNGHVARIGWDDYSTNVLNFYFKYAAYSAVNQNVTLAAGKRVAGIAMYVDAAEVTCYVDGVEVATAAQTATLAATHYAFTGTSTGGQHVSRYGDTAQSKGTTCAGSLFGPKALARELSRNPWAAFAPRDRGVVMVSASGPALQTISPSAIASDEAFGTAVVGRGAVAVAPTGIASGEAFGTAVVGRGAVAVAPSAIASGEAFGTAVVSGGAIVVAPTGIASAEAFGTAVVGRGAVAVAPTAIDSGEAFGTATLRNGSTVSAVAIASAEAFGTAVVTPGGVIVSPPSIDSGQAFGTATVGDGSAAVLAAPRLRPGAARAARPPRVQSGRRAPNLSASRRSWR